jgi:hypothetical protein
MKLYLAMVIVLNFVPFIHLWAGYPNLTTCGAEPVDFFAAPALYPAWQQQLRVFSTYVPALGKIQDFLKFHNILCWFKT